MNQPVSNYTDLTLSSVRTTIILAKMIDR